MGGKLKKIKLKIASIVSCGEENCVVCNNSKYLMQIDKLEEQKRIVTRNQSE